MSASDVARHELEKKHQQELKELKAKIDTILKQEYATKAERKAKLTETQQMEDELRSKHLEEMADLLTGGDDDLDYDALATLSVQPTAAVAAPSKQEASSKPAAKKVSKAQKRRDAKTQEEKARRERIEQARAQEETLGEKEAETIRVKLLELHLESVDIPSDGNCLYHAIGHQLTARGRQGMSAFLLRAMASNFMQNNPDEFLPFMIDSEESFEEHCHKVATLQSLWGGQMEALALSKSLQLPVWVLSAENKDLRFGDEFLKHDAPIVLTFHRYLFALGKHYNSAKPISVQMM
jgi:OTU domain-containing protein 6